MSSQQQLHLNDQNRVAQQMDLPHSNQYTGTDVMGEPVHPTHQSGHNANFPAAGVHNPATDLPATTGGSNAPPADHPSSVPSSAAGDFPSAQTPPYRTGTSLPSSASNFPSVQTPAHRTGACQPSAAQAPTTPSPYVQTASVSGAAAKSPMDNIMQVLNKWSKKAEDVTGNVWNHLRTGPNVAETALGRIALGTKAMTEGGLENIFRQTFEVAPDEHLLKTYACYLSTSTGPVAGTLYISSHKLAFCSDRALAIPGSPPASNNSTTTPSVSSPTKTSSAANNTSSAHQQQQWCYYKVMVPISQLQAVTPSENTEKKPPEKYVQVQTIDGHEFWFMGFVHYDKGVKNLQESLLSKTTGTTIDTTKTPGATSDMNAASNVVI